MKALPLTGARGLTKRAEVETNKKKGRNKKTNKRKVTTKTKSKAKMESKKIYPTRVYNFSQNIHF